MTEILSRVFLRLDGDPLTVNYNVPFTKNLFVVGIILHYRHAPSVCSTSLDEATDIHNRKFYRCDTYKSNALFQDNMRCRIDYFHSNPTIVR